MLQKIYSLLKDVSLKTLTMKETTCTSKRFSLFTVQKLATGVVDYVPSFSNSDFFPFFISWTFGGDDKKSEFFAQIIAYPTLHKKLEQWRSPCLVSGSNATLPRVLYAGSGLQLQSSSTSVLQRVIKWLLTFPYMGIVGYGDIVILFVMEILTFASKFTTQTFIKYCNNVFCILIVMHFGAFLNLKASMFLTSPQ